MADDVLDAGLEIESTEAETTETGTETAPITDTAPTQEIATELTPGTQQGAPPTAKALYERAKALDPELAKGIRQLTFKGEEFLKAVPGGLKEVAELRNTIQRIEQLGGDEGIQGVAKELDGWRQFDEQFMAADPKVLDFILEEPQGQEALLKLAPAVFNKYAEMDPKGFTAYIMQRVKEDIVNYQSDENDQIGIPLALERLGDAIGDNAPAKALLNYLKGYFRRVDAWSRNPISTRGTTQAGDPKAQTDLQRRQADIEQREATALRNEYNTEAFNQIKPIYEQEFAKLLGNRKINDRAKQALEELFSVRYMKARQPALAKAEQYFKGKDRAGFVKFTVNSARELVPRIMREVFDTLLPGKPGPQAGKPGTPPARAGAPAKPAPGFTPVVRQPRTDEFDWSNEFNTPSNIQAGRGILKDGRKVSWKRATS